MVLACVAGLAGCSRAAPPPDPGAGEGPAPFQLREGVSLRVAGELVEVRRARAEFSPAAFDGETGDGTPAIAVDGLSRGPDAYGRAFGAILTACGIDPGEADANWQVYGIEGDLAQLSDFAVATMLIPVRLCPGLDGGQEDG